MNNFRRNIFILLRSTRGVSKVPFNLTLYLTYPPLGSGDNLKPATHLPVAVMPQTVPHPVWGFLHQLGMARTNRRYRIACP